VLPIRVEVPPIVERGAKCRTERVPQAMAAARKALESDRRILGREDLGHLLTVNRVAALRHHVKFVSVFDQNANRRFEVPQEPETADRKKDSHSRRQTTLRVETNWRRACAVALARNLKDNI